MEHLILFLAYLPTLLQRVPLHPPDLSKWHKLLKVKIYA